MRMNHTHHHHIDLTERHDARNPIYTVLLVVCSSFVIGSIPIIYGLSLDGNSPEANVTTTPHNPWSVLGERDR